MAKSFELSAAQIRALRDLPVGHYFEAPQVGVTGGGLLKYKKLGLSDSGRLVACEAVRPSRVVNFELGEG